LAKYLKTKIITIDGKVYLLNNDIRINVITIPLSVAELKDTITPLWKNTWFKEDLCSGPGNAFFILPDGSVKPCCGYATKNNRLTLGNIYKDKPEKLISNAYSNRLIYTIFNTGLIETGRRLEENGVSFPGKTDDPCYFCYYLLNNIPSKTLENCLD
jgi:sulfatase maturation enzyme AslB (radical SAM superfamily)